MLKRKIFAVALPIIAGATIVGSGFAAWVFGTQTSSILGPTIGVDITNSMDLDNVKLKVFTVVDNNGTGETPVEVTESKNNKFKIELDQGGHDESSKDNIDKGIRIKNENGETIKRFEIYVECKDDSLVNMKAAGFTVNFKADITFNSTLLKYVKVNQTSTWAENCSLTNTDPSNVYTTGEVALNIPETFTEQKTEYYLDGQNKRMQLLTSSTIANSESTGNSKYYENNKLLQWETNDGTGVEDTFTGKPKSKGQVEKMRKEIGGLEDAVKIDFSLSVTDPDVK